MEAGSNGNEEVLYISWFSKTGALSSGAVFYHTLANPDCFLSLCVGGGSYPSAGI